MLKKYRNLITLAIALLLVFAAHGNAEVNVGLSLSFHDALSPYGTWVNVNGCTDCWHPNASGFVPFTNGYWADTPDYGLTWVGNEPYEWAPYHYGQWVFVPQMGWVWQPGYQWSPAPVTWAYGDNYVGWSPILQGTPAPDPNLWVF